MHVREIIKSLGGRQALSELTGTNVSNISNWLRLGIPAKYHRRLVDHAASLSLDEVTFDALESAETDGAASEVAA